MPNRAVHDDLEVDAPEPGLYFAGHPVRPTHPQDRVKQILI